MLQVDSSNRSATISKPRSIRLSAAIRIALRSGRVTLLAAGVVAFASTHAATPPRGLNGGVEGFAILGTDAVDAAGEFLGGGADVNGDGVSDFFVGAPYANRGGGAFQGEAYLVFGRSEGFPEQLDLSTLFGFGGGDGSQGAVFQGINERDYAGDSVDGVGDVNGDGFDDFIIGSPRADPHGDGIGQSYVIFGGQDFPAKVLLETLLPDGGGDGTSGFVISGVPGQPGSGAFGSGAGDVNDDGFDDLIVGASVIFGRERFPPVFECARLLPPAGGDGRAGFVLKASDPAGVNIVRAAGDVNGDGIADLVAASIHATVGGRPRAGRAYVIYGHTGSFVPVFPLATLLPGSGGDGSAGFVMTGVAENDYTGRSVNAAGDVNGDGIDDVIIGADGADPHGTSGAGRAYVVFGAQAAPALLDLRALLPAFGGDGSAGFVLNGVNASDAAGRAVDGAGDINADGIDDLVVGAELADADNRSGAGHSYVVFGRRHGFPPVFELRSLLPENGGDGSRGFVAIGTAADDRAGHAVSAVGDIVGDGIDDLAIGTEHNLGFVIYGRVTAFPAVIDLADMVTRHDD